MSIIYIITFLWIVFIFSCRKNKDVVSSTPPQEQNHKVQDPSRDIETIDANKDRIINMDGRVLDKNRLIMKYKSPLVYRYQKADTPYIEFVGGIKGNFFNSKTGNPSGKVDANYGIYQYLLNRIYFKGNVKLVNSKGEVLKAEDLWWDKLTERIHTQNKISFLQGGSKLYGKGLDAKDDMSEYTVRQITGKINDKKF